MSILEILRLTEQEFSQREIAVSVNCGKSTVGEVQKRSREAQLTYEEARNMTNRQLHERLYGLPNASTLKQDPDWETLENWLKQGKRRNLQLAWETYRQTAPDGLGYSQYCKRYRQWQDQAGRNLSMVQEHEPGKELYIDWVGDTLDSVVDAESGEVFTAHFFVASLGCSQYPYVEAFANEGLENWITANVHALEHIGGVPRIIIPDNCKTAVTKASHYVPEANPTYAEFAQHYSVAIIPARVRKPKDKPVVEGSVGWLETWLLEWLRGKQYFSFGDLNQEIRVRMQQLAERPFQKRSGSRVSDYLQLDKPALRPLPKERFEMTVYATRRVPENYFVEYEGFYYSVPYTLYKSQVTVRATASVIEIIDDNRERVALHTRRFMGSRYVLDATHMPEKHRKQHEYSHRTGSDYLNWAANIGACTHSVIEKMLKAQQIEEAAYKSCSGILHLAEKYSSQRLEEACQQALTQGQANYAAVLSLIKQPAPPRRIEALPTHSNLRNPAEFA